MSKHKEEKGSLGLGHEKHGQNQAKSGIAKHGQSEKSAHNNNFGKTANKEAHKEHEAVSEKNDKSKKY